MLKDARARLARLYPELADRCAQRFAMLCGRYGVGCPAPAAPRAWSEQDAVLITYADMVVAPDEKPLATLKRFLDGPLEGAFNTVHVLPFFPWSSDDGFSVIHFRQVHADFGDWSHVQELAKSRRLMVDLVLNHVSRQSGWFLDYVSGVAPGRDYFIEVDPGADLSKVVRPRTHPLLTPVHTPRGKRSVWTTFSADQVDLNFANPDVFFELLDILLFYVSMGASVIRMDAIAYLWKRIGTTCIHLPETHEVVKFFRRFLDIVAPEVWLLTETNVPHEENVSYFGDGDEAHLVYQFSLPPLALHAMTFGHARAITAWAANLAPPPPGCTFLNFTASHDGIGVRPLAGWAPEGDVLRLADEMKRRGGQVSLKRNEDGSESPYELNITWFDAMRGAADEPEDLRVRRFLCSQAIPLVLRGIPAVYFHSLTATPNDHALVRKTNQARSINRKKWFLPELDSLLAEPRSAAARVLNEYRAMLAARKRPAFHPDAPQVIHALDDRVFAVQRGEPGGDEVLALFNVSSETAKLKSLPMAGPLTDLLSTRAFAAHAPVSLGPCEFLWLTRK